MRTPDEHRRLLTVGQGDRGLYELVLSPGVGACDLAEVAAGLRDAVYEDALRKILTSGAYRPDGLTADLTAAVDASDRET